MKKSAILKAFIIIFAFILLISTRVFAYSVESEKITDKHKTYSLKINYPQIKDKKAEGVKAFNKMIKDYAVKKKAEFIDEAKKEYNPQTPTWSMDYTYEVHLKTDSFISLMMNGCVYTGGAHPYTELNPVNYNLKTGKNLKLKDVFKKDSDYLKKLSKNCIDELKKKGVSDSEWIEKGAAPKEKNYDKFYFIEGALVIVFPQYQVAPYVAGPQEIKIKLSDLKEMLNPDIPLEY